MGRTLHIAVIADDLTGAADAGVQFCPAVGPVHLAGPGEGALTGDPVCGEGLAVFTNTRHADPSTAADAVRQSVEGIRKLNPAVIYKKIDSCLRGNLGAEIDALLQATGLAASFVAPALPQQGRTTVGDCHLVNGVPVAESEIGRDPRCPVRESRLSVLLASQSRLPVGHVGLDCIAKGSAAMAERVRRLLDRGCRHIAFDARQTAHLDAVAGLARDRFAGILPVGSAGLAGSLSRGMMRDLPGITPPRRPAINRWLLVCGSASRIMAEQVASLERSTGWAHLAMDPAALSAADGAIVRPPPTARKVEAKPAGGVILSVQPLTDAGPAQDPGRVVRGLAQAAVALVDTMAPQGVFLSGGDTAESFWHAIGARALNIRQEVLTGLVLGEFFGGPHHGLTVVTKAGSFGHADTLIKLIRCLE